MAPLPQERPEQAIAELIYKGVERTKKRDFYLSRLGASGIGKECLRRIFYDWRGYSAKEPEGRMSILFETGEIYETRMVEWLRMIGLAVWDKNPDTGKQYDYSHPTGHFTVRIDGVVRGVTGDEKTPHLLEIKTMNQRSYDSLEKDGIQKSNPEHYIQCQMGMNGMGLSCALYMAVNKNNEQIHVERIPFHQPTVDEIEAKIKNLVEATLTPAGISATASAFGCRFCPHKEVCVGKEPPQKNCRTCHMGNPGPEGMWVCGLDGSSLEYKKQLVGCQDYEARQEKNLAAYLSSG